MMSRHPWTEYGEVPQNRILRPTGFMEESESTIIPVFDREHIMSESEYESKGFKVTDRRKFTSEGEPRPEEESSARPEEPRRPSTKPASEKGSSAGAEPKAAPGSPAAERQAAPPPDVGFIDLVSMLANNALVQLGEVPEPVTGERVENLPGVQVMIGFLGMLQTKTKGNLEKEEERLLDDVLYDLRMRYMAKANLIKL